MVNLEEADVGNVQEKGSTYTSVQSTTAPTQETVKGSNAPGPM